MIKPVLTACLAGLFTFSTAASADLVVLQYHHVSPITPASTSTSPSLFKRQLDMVERLGLEVVPLDSGTRDALDGKLADRQQVAITFDDAYESVWEVAAPLLRERGFPFTVFVNTSAIGKQGYMTWDQLETWAASPDVLIANHTEDHDHLPQKPGESDKAWRKRITASLDDAQETLKKRLKTSLPSLAYPYGEFDDKVEAAVAERDWLGYGQHSGAIGESSVSTRLPRFPLATAYGDLDTLETKLRSRALPVNPETLPSGVMQENPPTLELTLADGLEPSKLNCFATGQGRIDVQRQVERSQTVQIEAPRSFVNRRVRYNCTYPRDDGSYYWFSHQWVDLSQAED
jgi:peptidoglycan/xylan/chitin deacetylase (PgdA/CDA1 family)